MSNREKIDIEVLGDSTLFSPAGKGVSYLVRAGKTRLLMECGANPFWGLGPGGVQALNGVIVSHAHFDHHRYLTDLALYSRYSLGRAIPLLGTEAVLAEMASCCEPALVRTLSVDGKRVTGVPYRNFVSEYRLGPRARYRLERRGSRGVSVWRAIEVANGQPADPCAAKAIVGPKGTWARLLVFDQEYQEWVDPESFYSFSDKTYYRGSNRLWQDDFSGLTVRAYKAPAWHGPSSTSIVFERGGARLAFSGDTVYDPDLWLKLSEEKRSQKLPGSRRSFNAAATISCDINRLIERTWSRRRYQDALKVWDGAVVFHDTDYPGSVVHTIYSKLSAAVGGANARWRGLVLAHTPDVFTSMHPLAYAGSSFSVTPTGLAGMRKAPVGWHKAEGKVYSLRKAENGPYAMAFEGEKLVLTRTRGGRPGLEMQLEADLGKNT